MKRAGFRAALPTPQTAKLQAKGAKMDTLQAKVSNFTDNVLPAFGLALTPEGKCSFLIDADVKTDTLEEKITACLNYKNTLHPLPSRRAKLPPTKEIIIDFHEVIRWIYSYIEGISSLIDEYSAQYKTGETAQYVREVNPKSGQLIYTAPDNFTLLKRLYLDEDVKERLLSLARKESKVPKLNSAEDVNESEYVVQLKVFYRLYGWCRTKTNKQLRDDSIKQLFQDPKNDIHKFARRFTENNNLLKQYVAVNKKYYEELKTTLRYKADDQNASKQIKADDAKIMRCKKYERTAFITFISDQR